MIPHVESVIADIAAGRLVILVDDEDRENEGDLCMAAEKVTPEAVNFMAKHGRGLICLGLTEARARELELPMMVPDAQNQTPFGTAFTVSIEARHGVTTGISAADRAQTIAVAIDPKCGSKDLVRPGHVFPLVAKEGGVLRRTGQTEGSVDLARLAGLEPAGVVCEIMNDDGTMARLPDLLEFSRTHGLAVLTIADLIKYRLRTERLVWRGAEAELPTVYGNFRTIVFKNEIDHVDHVALVKGEIRPDEPTLVRVHSECLSGDAFGSLRCDCGEQLMAAMQMIANEGKGVILYMRQEGRGIGLENKIKAYSLQDQEGLDTVQANERLGFPADLRDYGVGAQILASLGVGKTRNITNNPAKRAGLEGYGLQFVERVPLEIVPNDKNLGYLRTKREKLGHLLSLMKRA
ncbi:MAG: bifunctional 3,4-dihydroxy-2-butanone-4-phosphate synthase/GTP cyclohydrolase II [Myxococcota bacterium]|nr:bifunctional 3,4-dihydroxy-2-butanone-4-phosphate synthase/GTP cyclohydrolase II [Myxococcota bacterium]